MIQNCMVPVWVGIFAVIAYDICTGLNASFCIIAFFFKAVLVFIMLIILRIVEHLHDRQKATVIPPFFFPAIFRGYVL